MKIRIAVAVLPNGEWNSCGYGRPGKEPTDEEKISYATDTIDGPGAQIYFVEAELPLPTITTIQGEVKTE